MVEGLPHVMPFAGQLAPFAARLGILLQHLES
jgi:hypothetical protein